LNFAEAQDATASTCRAPAERDGDLVETMYVT
jgi:hypothetical protein